jgi:hypothetical protein
LTKAFCCLDTDDVKKIMKKNKTIIKTVILIFIISYVVYNVNYHTTWMPNSFLHHHYGKDNGIIRQAESVCILSALFYFILANRKKMLFLLFGFGVGLFTFILSTYVSYGFTDSLIFPHILACVLFISLFYVLPTKWVHGKSSTQDT